MNAPIAPEEVLAVEFSLNGVTVGARPGETLIQVADRLEVPIPRLCYKPGMRPDGNCRSCMVEIKGERVLAPSCCRAPTAGMEVRTDSPRALHAQKLVVEMLAADVPERVYKLDSELAQWQRWLGVTKPRFASRAQPAADISHPAMAVNLDACIQCTRCVRACREEQVNDVIGYAFRGAHSKIVFDLDDPMGASTCVACGECVQACPTGALAPANDAYLAPVKRKVPSVCPYCGVGCQITYHVGDAGIVLVEGRDGLANHSRLCVKGRFGFDYVRHPQRLMKPLIRRADVPKSPDFTMDPARVLDVFREASWDEALALAADTLKRIRDERGPKALAGFGSAKGSNEEAYLFQKLVRTGFGSNNVDHCTRLCHASSVVALLEGIGSGAVSNPVMDVLQAEVVLLIGANPVVNHPVAATWIKNAVKRGTKLILADPRRSELARHATHYLQFKPDTDVALLNAMMHTIVEEGLVDQQFVRARTTGYEEIRANVADYSPEAMAPICGVPAATIREVARLFARSRGSMILWGMGISQHVHGTDNARCLIALTMLTGQVGRPGTGLHPLRGQNNVQGASDAGLIPMVFPDYQRVDNTTVRDKFEALWGAALDPEPGLTVVEIMNAVHAGEIRGMYIMGENPAMSDPDLQHARQALSELEMLVVQDIFLTETGYLADVILPASAFPEKTGTFTNTDRLVQLGRQALDLPGDTRHDLADHHRDGAKAGPRLDLYASARGFRRNAESDAVDRRHHVGAARGGKRGHVSVRTRRRPGRARRVHRRFPDGQRQGEVRSREAHSCERAPGRRVSVRPDHGPAARALAYRQHDPPYGSAGRDRAVPRRVVEPGGPAGVRCRTRWSDHGGVAPRRSHALGARGRGYAARRSVHSVLLLRSGGEPAHEPRARPVRQDSGVQVLRGAGERRRRDQRDDRLQRAGRPVGSPQGLA